MRIAVTGAFCGQRIAAVAMFAIAVDPRPERLADVGERARASRAEAVVRSLCLQVQAAGGRALLVGGCVRDQLLGLPAKDFDLETYGLAPRTLLGLLESQYGVNLVGQSFGVIKIKGLPIDVSIPRRESKAGLGHKGFEVLSDPLLTPAEAARRRDFTMNAIAVDPLTRERLDPFGGVDDLQRRILRHVSAQFAEDPLRVLRGMQFIARFDLAVAPETVALCAQLDPEGLAPERQFEEWTKLLLQGIRPSRGLAFLRDCGWIRYYPELAALIGCPQDPEWHPEGDVWIHTQHCLDAFAGGRTGDAWEDLVVGLAVLCHDLGKPATTAFADGRYRSPGHAEQGEGPTRSLLMRLTRQTDLVEAVVPLVLHHMRPSELHRCGLSASAVRRLSRKVGRIDRLVRVARCDSLGCPPSSDRTFPAGDALLERARALELERQAPQPLILGRHLIALGLTPGPRFGPILDRCFEAQLNGAFATVNDGLAFARRCLEHPPR